MAGVCANIAEYTLNSTAQLFVLFIQSSHSLPVFLRNLFFILYYVLLYQRDNHYNNIKRNELSSLSNLTHFFCFMKAYYYDSLFYFVI